MGAFGVMGGAILAPGLPTLIKPFGATAETIGLVLSVYTVAAAISLPVTGFLIDLCGRKPVGIGCLLLDGTFALLALVAPNFIVLLVFRFFQGIGIAGLIPVAMTVIGDWYDDQRRLKAIGLLSGAISVSAVVLPLLGGWLASISWRLPFVVYGLSLLLAVLFIIFIEESKPEAEGGETQKLAKEYFGSLKEVLQIAAIRELLGHALVIYFLLYSLVTFLPLFLSGVHGFSEFVAGIALSAQGFFSAVVASQADQVDYYLDWGQKIALGFGLIALGLGLMPLWSTGNYVFLSLFLFGVGMGTAQPTIYDRTVKLPPEELKGAVVAIFNTMKFIGMSLAPLVLRFFAAHYNLATVFLVSSLLAVVWLVAIGLFQTEAECGVDRS
nr:MFS transporter [Natroniella sulfidigena]